VFRRGRWLYRVTEPLITFYEVVMRPEWYRLGSGQAEDAWRDQQVGFFSRVVGPHFESLCRSFDLQAGSGLFGALVGEVGSGIVNDPANRTQIEVGVAVLAPPEPGRPRRLLSLGEVKWGQVMTPQHITRLARARDLLAASFDIGDGTLACYSAAGFSADLRSAAGPGLILISSGDLCAGGFAG
jgi:uncharacterized protein